MCREGACSEQEVRISRKGEVRLKGVWSYFAVCFFIALFEFLSLGGDIMHQALYRKWRPQIFDDVCGQEHITSILKYETENNKFSHAYLFCGSRGTGKTTCAKILAKAVNCESPVNGSPCNKCPSCRSIDAGTATDVLEMDAASNNGVDNIRDIRDEVVYSPSALKYRVYIVDEVHMLSGSAFNALLKTLEEPPSHVVFILATTELQKLPSTIISRCQRFDFRRIGTDVLVDRLAFISDKEGIEYETDALRVIARLARGGMRDAISLLELCAGTRRKVTVSVVDETVGSGGRENIENTARAIATGDFDALFSAVDDVARSSRDISVFWQELISYYRDMLVLKTSSSAARYLDLTEGEVSRLSAVADLFSKETLVYHCRILDDTTYAMQKSGGNNRMTAEMALIKMCDTSLDTSVDALLSRISKLESALASGVMVPREKNVATEVKPVDKTEAKNADAKPSEGDADLNENTVPTATELVLRNLRGWNDIVERACENDGSSRGFLKIAKAYVGSDGKIYIKFPNDFAKGRIERTGAKMNLLSAIKMAGYSDITEAELVLGLVDGKEVVSDLDEFDV